MMAADRIIRWSTAGAVVGVAAVAAVASYEHAYDLVRAHGEVGWPARLVDGLIYASSMVMLASERRKAPVPGLAAGRPARRPASVTPTRPGPPRGRGTGLAGCTVVIGGGDRPGTSTSAEMEAGRAG